MKNTGTLKVTTPTPNEIVMTRVFDAPRAMVYQAFTTPALIRRWYGPRGHEMTVCELDARVGGAWRFVSRGPGGPEVGFGGVIRELSPPDRIVMTEIFDPYPTTESINTTTFAERDGKTTVTISVWYPSQLIRDMVVQSGMEHGAAESYDKLAELLAAA